ncbi:MAG: DNA polymerase III subunit gamma/tau [Pseudomonadota bacterium]
MTNYLVLARKWRPKTFQDLIGQSHVIGALTGAFERGHLHHAYLLTGTRGIGKTTIARILAKSFNCETGVTATPCGICSACTQIDAGRFPDMFEIDAASHTGVDNVREILDNAHYLPTMGRHKVYLIDEVHMLSKAAFNAMLKTLEEPPLHVKFILATTDPQKIPPTVLSRCLQFHLRPLQKAQIETRFDYILKQENINFESPALSLLANAAQGSLRDGLSLLDQAIAYGGGYVQESVVRNMLGIVNQSMIFDLLETLAENQAEKMDALLYQLAEETHTFEAILDELAQKLHQIALIQQVPSALQHYVQDAARLDSLSQLLQPETVQLFYQIVLHGKRDFSLAPDAFTGLSMTLLRMLSFRTVSPNTVPSVASQPKSTINNSLRPSSQTRSAPAATFQNNDETENHSGEPSSSPTLKPEFSVNALKPIRTQAAQPMATPASITEPQEFKSVAVPTTSSTTLASEPIEASSNISEQSEKNTATPIIPAINKVPEIIQDHVNNAPLEDVLPSSDIKNNIPSLSRHSNAPDSNEAWQDLFPTIKTSPMVRQLLLQSAWSRFDHTTSTLFLTLAQQHKHLLIFQKELHVAIQAASSHTHHIEINVHEATNDEGTTLDTPSQRIKHAEQEQQSARVETFSKQPFVQTICEATGAKIDEQSVQPII